MLICLVSFGQGIMNDIGNALGSGDVNGISRHFEKAVVLTIEGSQGTYSRSQAEMILRDFFSKNNVKGFSEERTGGNNGMSYTIGILSTGSGKFRTYISVRQKERTFVIQEIRIEKQ